jgi:intracellular septation protein A
MWKIVVVLVLTALAILMARVASHAPLFDSRIGTAVSLDSTAVTADVCRRARVGA